MARPGRLTLPAGHWGLPTWRRDGFSGAKSAIITDFAPLKAWSGRSLGETAHSPPAPGDGEMAEADGIRVNPLAAAGRGVVRWSGGGAQAEGHPARRHGGDRVDVLAGERG